MSKIIRRIERKLGVENITSLLGDELDPTDLQSLMLDVYRRVAKRRDPSTLLGDYKSNRFSRPSELDPAKLVEWDKIALSNLPEGFQALELSPLCPLGTISSLAPISQDWIVTTIRNAEVMADPTNLLALECAVRRDQLKREGKSKESSVELAASQRVVRSQRHDSPTAQSHFRLFSMCSAGRDTGNLGFESTAISKHVAFYLKCLRLYFGDKFPLRAEIFDLAPTESHRATIFSELVEEMRKTTNRLTVDLGNQPDKAKGYYSQVRFHLYATTAQGVQVELADGGDVDWTRKLLGNAKERLVISGIGTERVCQNFENKPE